ncbi:MAG: hypothetical protein INR64_07415 [Caulobacteraceae bacterium]|nr:hypothetical protein [Caulobacter sp.]
MRDGGTAKVRAAGLGLAATMTLVSGCGRAPAPATAGAPAARADPEFRAPPALLGAERDAAGAVTLRGRAPAGATVALRSPDGAAYAAPVSPQGDWSLRLPAAPAPRAFSLAADVGGGRVIRAEGGLLVAPAPFAVATLLRGGAPALPIAAPGAGFRWTGLDTDPGGGAAVSGFAAPGAALRMAIDGVVRGEGAADAAGRFGVLWLGGAVPPGEHTVAVIAPDAVRAVAVRFGPASLGNAPVLATREADGWRIDWAPPGGGVQTLRLLAPDAASAGVR